MRIDKYLVENGYFESRNRAIDAIKRGKITIDGKLAKPSTKCTPLSNIQIEPEKFYISRASQKLELFLKEYPLNLEGRRALDIGSSTGGFVQILLEAGVESVTAVDVGSNQLHPILRANKRVVLHEETDIREFHTPNRFDIVTSDVSFISTLKIVESIDRLALQDIILLFKPQFEVGKGVKRNSKGVVTDIKAIEMARIKFEKAINRLGWSLCYSTTSKIQGKLGNIEYIYHFEV